jgi:hypothetical protein
MTDPTHDSDEAQPDGPIARRADTPMPSEGEAAIEQQAVGDDEWSAETRLFRVVPAEDEADQYTDDVLGVGVSFPEAGVYVDWHLEAFPDPLDDPHVSEYGSVVDFRKATGNQIVDFTPPAGAISATEQEKWVEETGPQGGDRWRNTETDEVVYDEPAGATGGGGEDDSNGPDTLSPEMATRRLGRAVNDAHVAGSPDEDTTAVHFDTDVPSFRNIQSAFMYDETTGEFNEGVARFGEIDIENADEVGRSAQRLAAESFENIVETADPPTDEYEADLGDFETAAPHFRLDGPTDADEMTGFMSRLTELVNERFFPYDATQRDDEVISQAAVEQQATFGKGEAVRWTWQGTPVHGRVAEKREEAATPEGADQQITGDDDEAVYLIDEWDDRVGGYRRENIAKPESSLDESQKDLPPRDENNYVDSQAWAALTTPVSQSIFTAQELTHAARSYDDVLQHSRPNEWLLPSEDPVVYRYEVPEKYLEGRSEEFFVPNAAMADAARKVQRWEDEHDDIAGGAADGEGARRRAQIIEHHDRGEPLAVEYWEEIRAYHDRHHSQGNHELGEEAAGEPWTAAGYVSHLNWGGDAGYEQAQRVMDAVEATEQESRITMKGAVAAEQSLPPRALTKADSNEVDLAALDGELREAVEADEFYVYGKASVEQWDDDEPPTLIQMDALEQALDRYFSSETAPGIISRHHQDIPVGTPVRSFKFSEATTLEIDGETYEFEAGDEVRTHVQDADGDGRPELWLAANIDGETEMGKKTRVLAAQGDLNGFSVTVHRNQDETTQEGRLVTDCDLHAVTIGSDEQIKNPGSEFDVADFKGPLKRVRDRVVSFIS